MDESVLGWRPLAEAWLANRSPQESHVSTYQGTLRVTIVSNTAKLRLQAQAYTKFHNTYNSLREEFQSLRYET